VRADELEHNRGAVQVVYDQIQSAHLVVADMTGRNSNVYYEVGYAHALGKDVILLTHRAEDLPFDLRGFNHIVYDGRITILKDKLAQRLKAIQSDGSAKK
jgi:nucleoside 2-deoxyribosyltransferase